MDREGRTTPGSAAVGRAARGSSRAAVSVCCAILGLAALGLSGFAPAQEAPKPPDSVPDFFAQRILPILSAHCFSCHGPEAAKVKGGLRMVDRASLMVGGHGGAAVQPGDPEQSELIRRVRYADAADGMPPAGKLPDEALRDLETWVTMGAPWPTALGHIAVGRGPEGVDFAAGRRWWAFRPLAVPAVPRVGHAAAVREPLDAFIVKALEAAGLAPGPRAEERELVRRLSHDLHGLPPGPEVLEAYARDTDPDKWNKLVERLLADPAYGERQARWWLDLVRYGETNGYERDAPKPEVHRYRDWVIDALQRDLPFDQFVRWQIAGDEYPPVTPEQLVATGFLRIGPWDDEPDDAAQALHDETDDQLRAITEGFLGLTVGCARCHDHRTDPIAQADYYGLAAFLRNVRPYENARFAADSATLRRVDSSAAGLAEWERQLEARRAQLTARGAELLELGRARVRASEGLAADAAVENPRAEQALQRPERRELRQGRRELETLATQTFQGQVAWALCAREKGGPLAPTQLLVRGDAHAPGVEVRPHFPPALCADDAAAFPTLPPAAPEAESSGARRVLADWIVGDARALTARVIVNRVWQQHFGRGLVSTPDDFGRTGEPPSHPELLEQLAAQFVAEGWSLKRLHRRILGSATWQRSSRRGDSLAEARDPENRLLWRQNARRLEAEVLRDSLLAVAGTLDRSARGGPAFYPRLSEQALAASSRPGEGWRPAARDEFARRSIYMATKRTLPVTLCAAFDVADPSLVSGRRSSTNLATQSLTLLNSEFANLCAAEFALRVLRPEEGGGHGADVESLVRRAFELALGRAPAAEELARLVQYFEQSVELLRRHETPLVLEWKVPRRVAESYLEQVAPTDLLLGPRSNWSYVAGRWSVPYNTTLGSEPDHGPAALFDGLQAADLRVEGRLRTATGPGFAAVLLRARSASAEPAIIEGFEVVEGLELRIPTETGGRLAVWRVEAGSASEVAGVDFPFASWEALQLTLELAGTRLAVALADTGSEQRVELAADVASWPHAGRFGLRSSGERLEWSGLALTAPAGRIELRPDDPGPVELRALESVCLSLFNLNEFLYVD